MAGKLVKINGLNDLRRKLKGKFKIVLNRSLRDKELQKRVASIIVDDMRKNYPDPGKTLLASPITQAFREFFEQFNSTHPDYRRPRINITFTGELLNDLIKGVKVDTTKLAFILEHTSGTHKPYQSNGTFKQKKKKVTSKSGKQRNVSVRVSYTTIQKKLKKMGYDYLKFEVTNPARQQIIKEIQKTLIRNIKKQFGQ